MADHPIDDLALIALRYAAGDLPPPEAVEFEGRMAADQAAREALGEAIRLSAAALQQPAPAPDSLFREAIRETLRPTLLSRVFPRRPYRGHPLAWTGLGAAAAIGLFVVGVYVGGPASEPATAGTPPGPQCIPTPGSVLAVDVTATRPAAPGPVQTTTGSLATNVATESPPAKMPETVPGSADPGDRSPMGGPAGPAIAADPAAEEAGRTNPSRRDPKSGLPPTAPSPSLILPGDVSEDDSEPALTISEA